MLANPPPEAEDPNVTISPGTEGPNVPPKSNATKKGSGAGGDSSTTESPWTATKPMGSSSTTPINLNVFADGVKAAKKTMETYETIINKLIAFVSSFVYGKETKVPPPKE